MKWEDPEEGGKPESSSANPNKLSISKKDSSSGNLNQKRCCNCKQSKCVKLYCECFANGVYCNPTCNCVDCWNNSSFEEQRKSAIQSTLEKNPNAFQPKISTPNFIEIKKAESNPNLFRHNKGCSCKKSGCMKKYCECFQAGIPCTELCKCVDCHNTKEYYDKLKSSKSNVITEPIKQEELGDSNVLFFNFLLAGGDEDLLSKLVADGKDPGQNRKDVALNQGEVEDLYKGLMKTTELPINSYFKDEGTFQHMGNYYDSVRKRVKKESSVIVAPTIKSDFDKPISNSQNAEVKRKEEPAPPLENDDLLCNDEDANELSNGFQQLEAVQEIFKSQYNKTLERKGSKEHKAEENGNENGDLNQNEENQEKVSFFALKKNKILKEFIGILRKLSGNND